MLAHWPNLKQLFISILLEEVYIDIYRHKIVQAIFPPQLRLSLHDCGWHTWGGTHCNTLRQHSVCFLPTGALYDDSYILLHISTYKPLLEINSAAFAGTAPECQQ